MSQRKRHDPWYAEQDGYYGKLYLDTYGKMVDATAAKETDFLVNQLALSKGMSILDVPCGHGRHAIELAKRGLIVTGQDLSSFSLARARENAESAGVAVSLRQGDMRDLPFDGAFDVAINLFTSFGYFDTEAEDQQFLAAIAKTLKPRGRFVLDFVNRELIIRGLPKANFKKTFPGGVTVFAHRTFNMTTGKDHCVSTHVYPDKRKTVVENYIRIYSLPELIGMCKRAGLDLQKKFGDFDASRVRIDSKRVILITKKM